MLKQFLENNHFEKFDNCIQPGRKCLEFSEAAKVNRDDKGWVYMWVITKKNEPILVIYVGQTKGTLSDRMKGHRNGSKLGKSAKGFSNAKYIKRFIKEYPEYPIYVYYRLSQTLKILDYNVPISQAEEIALIDLIKTARYGDFLLNTKTTKKAAEFMKTWFINVADFLNHQHFSLPDKNLRTYKVAKTRKVSKEK